MDLNVAQLVLYLTATFAAALVTGMAGFAFGLIATSMWLYVLSPVQTATLISAFGLVVQGVSVWKLRYALKWRRLWPFLIGGALGVPLGVAVLEWANPTHVRYAIGAILIVYSIYALARPALKVSRATASIDASIGFLNGILGGLTGLAGILTTIWCGMRAWRKDEQRAVFQPVGVAIFAMTTLWLGAKGGISTETAWLFLIGFPMLLAGTWAGLNLYGKLDEAGFRRVVLVLLLMSGIALVVPMAALPT